MRLMSVVILLTTLLTCSIAVADDASEAAKAAAEPRTVKAQATINGDGLEEHDAAMKDTDCPYAKAFILAQSSRNVGVGTDG